MRWGPLIWLTILAATAVGGAMAATLASLENSIEKAERNYTRLSEEMGAQKRRNEAAIQALNQQTIQLIRLQQWPPALLYTQSLLSLQPDMVTLLKNRQSYLQQELEQTRKRLDSYLALHRQAQQQLTNLNSLKRQLAATRHHLSRRQRSALDRAQIRADILANSLAKGIEAPASEPLPPPVIPGLQPVAGQAMPAGDGAFNYLAAAGANVVAVKPGKVVYSGPFRTMGGLVIVESPGNVYGVYAGLGTLEVELDQAVEVGRQLGTLPRTARPRLYFELRRNGQPISLK